MSSPWDRIRDVWKYTTGMNMFRGAWLLSIIVASYRRELNAKRISRRELL